MNNPEDLDVTTLGKLVESDEATIASFVPGHKDYKYKLMAMGLTPGADIKVLRVAPLGDPIQIMIRGSHLSLRKDEADCVKVRKA